MKRFVARIVNRQGRGLDMHFKARHKLHAIVSVRQKLIDLTWQDSQLAEVGPWSVKSIQEV